MPYPAKKFRQNPFTSLQVIRQTDRQTDRTKNITSFFGGGNNAATRRRAVGAFVVAVRPLSAFIHSWSPRVHCTVLRASRRPSTTGKSEYSVKFVGIWDDDADTLRLCPLLLFFDCSRHHRRSASRCFASCLCWISCFSPGSR